MDPYAALREKSKPLILVVDKNNEFGGHLNDALSSQATVVLVSSVASQTDTPLIHVAYSSLKLQIPDATYQAVLYVWTKETEHLLEPLQEWARIHGGSVSVVVSCREEEAIGCLQEKPVQLFLVGDVFAGEHAAPLDEFLKTAKETKHIALSHMGLAVWYPVAYKDVVEQLARVVFKRGQEIGKRFLGPQHEYTELSIAHSLQKVDPELSVDFTSVMQPTIPAEHAPSLFDSYDSTGKLQEYYRSLVVTYKSESKKMGVLLAKPNQPKKPHMFLYAFLLLVFFIFLAPLVGVGSTALGAVLLQGLVPDILKGQYDLALSKARAAESVIVVAKSSLQISASEFSFVGKPQVESFQKKAEVLGQFSEVAQEGITAAARLSDILKGKTLTATEDAQQAGSAIKQLDETLSNISSQDIPKNYQQTFSDAKRLVGLSAGIADELPQLLGTTGDKTYLILFQNNMELRPGGGFIGSYGLLQLHNGMVKNFSIQDVYDADGQLKGHVEPAFAIRRYIPIVHLYLRDSNFDPDFTKNAQTAASLLAAETGVHADGVAGIDLSVMQRILEATGSVFVPSYNQSVTSSNFFTLFEEHAEKNFFPGSTQKKDFLRSFMNALVSTLQQGKVQNPLLIVHQAVSLVNGKDILVALPDQLLESPLLANGLSDSLLDTRASSSSTLQDTLGIVEANLGVNKANAYVTRGIKQHISIDSKGQVQETVAVTYTNTSDGTWPGGVYRNYLRFLLPHNATLTSVSFDNVEQHIVPAITDPAVYEAKNFTAPKGLEVAREDEAGKTMYGFLVTVPFKTTMTITISYALSDTFPLTSLAPQYSLAIWKQPGISSIPYDVEISLPDGVTSLGQNTLSTTITKDTTLLFSFSNTTP